MADSLKGEWRSTETLIKKADIPNSGVGGGGSAITQEVGPDTIAPAYPIC